MTRPERGAPIRILVADDDAVVRTGLRVILESDGQEVVGEAADGEEAVRLARALRPDVVLMDVRMPGVDGVAATGLLAGPEVAEPMTVVVLTAFDLDEAVYSALRAGARGFIIKAGGPRLLLDAVRAAAAGDAILSPSVTGRLLEHFAALRSGGGAAPSSPLSDREVAVAVEVAHGRTNPEIAEDLLISLSTVKAHLASAQRKIGARNRTEIAVWVWEAGLARQA